MSGTLRGVRIGFLERPHPAGHVGALADGLVPLLRDRGARVSVVHAEVGGHRLDRAPDWDLTVLKSGSPSALHLAAAAEAWGSPCVNPAEGTRLAQDRLASAAILRRAGLPVPPARLVGWLGVGGPSADPGGEPDRLLRGPLVVKSARGSRGNGLWFVEPGALDALVPSLPAGPHLLMERIPHSGDDLKVYVAGAWLAAIERPFPAESLAEKRGRPATPPPAIEEIAREAGRLLGLSCYGCDFIRSADGWVLVDVNAFPGYKGLDAAPQAVAAEIGRVIADGERRTSPLAMAAAPNP